MGRCVGGCRNMSRRFFGKDSFLCHHLMRYNLAIKFLCCIACGNACFRYPMGDNRNAITMDNSILPWTYNCNCLTCKVPAQTVKCFRLTPSDLNRTQ